MSGAILILAPRGRDAGVIGQVLTRAGMHNVPCADLACVIAHLQGEIDALLVTEEALTGADLPGLLAWIADQPPWSDLPVIVLATRQPGRRGEAASNLLARLGNVILLERPINAETLSSAATGAVRARQRQYQTRLLLAEQLRATEALRQLNDTLEQRVEERARELDRTQATLSFALAAAGMGSWDLDLLTDTAHRSPEHDRIFGYDSPPAHWSMARFLDHVLPEDRDMTEAAFVPALQRGTLDLECRIRRADGQIRWITARGRASFAPDGTPRRLAGVVMDTTDRRQTEDALHQAQKMESIGQLTGGVAHDFNNLLTVIVGGLDMMLRRPEDSARVTRLATAAMAAARRGEQLTQQLLAFSRQQVLRPLTLDANALLAGFEALAQRAVGEAIALRFDLAADVPPIRIDAAQFESAVLNLIVNARDAMAGSGTITVATARVARRGADCIMVSVSDTGSGMDEATMARVFEPFFTTKDVGRGSGLGLSQVYGFARSAGGAAEIESTPGQGTTVRLFFPASADGVTVEHADPEEGRPLRGAALGETVLLVEDDEQVRAMAVDSLRELEYTVVVARNAAEALDHLGRSERIDVMFSDVVMPGGMNGAQLAAQARRLRPSLKILLTSGYTGQSGAGALAGQDLPLLTKPYRRDELARTLRVVLAGR